MYVMEFGKKYRFTAHADYIHPCWAIHIYDLTDRKLVTIIYTEHHTPLSEVMSRYSTTAVGIMYMSLPPPAKILSISCISITCAMGYLYTTGRIRWRCLIIYAFSTAYLRKQNLMSRCKVN